MGGWFQKSPSGKGLQRIHAHAALGRLGVLHIYEQEEFWYEDYFKEFKFESNILVKDPFLEEYKTSLFTGARKLIKINTKLFQTKRETIKKMITDQISMMQQKRDTLSEGIFQEFSRIFN